MELFRVVNRKTLEVLKKCNNKMEAKTFRDSLISPEDLIKFKKSNGKMPMDFVVSLGKDHRNFKGA
jgi:hypothetical protein